MLHDGHVDIVGQVCFEPPVANEVMQLVNPPMWFEHSAADFEKYWPIREARLVPVCLSVLTVLFCCLAGAEVTGRAATGLLAGSLAAFLPQFTFRGMNVSDDALVTLFGL